MKVLEPKVPSSSNDCDVECGVWYKKADNRLFPDLPLYCEGYPKPLLRGVSHLITAVVLPFAWILLLSHCHDNLYAKLVTTSYILCKLACYGASALFHVFEWSPKSEILMQKLDHCGIAVQSLGTVLPMSALLLPSQAGTLLFLISFSCCVWTCYRVFTLQPSLAAQALTAVWWIPPYSYLLFYRMTPLEGWCVLMVCLLKGCGVLVFVYEKPDPFPNVFGYHEIFHLFVIAAGVCIFLANWSIISRCSDGSCGQ